MWRFVTFVRFIVVLSLGLYNVASAATLTLPEGGSLLLRDATPIAGTGAEVRFEHKGGWALLFFQDKEQQHLKLHANRDATLTQIDGQWKAKGDPYLSAQLLAAAWAATHAEDSLQTLPTTADKLQSELDKVPNIRTAERKEAYLLGLASLARLRLKAADRQELLLNERWGHDLAAALGWSNDIIDIPAYVAFLDEYGTWGVDFKQKPTEVVSQAIARSPKPGRWLMAYSTIQLVIANTDAPEAVPELAMAAKIWQTTGPHKFATAWIDELIQAKTRITPNTLAPDLAAKGTDGSPHTFSEFRGRPLVVDFWSTDCGPCIAAIPKLKKLSERHEERVQFVAVAVQKPQTVNAWRALIKRKGWKNNWLHLVDTENQTLSLFGVNAIPRYLVLDAKGTVITLTGELEEVDAALKEAFQKP